MEITMLSYTCKLLANSTGAIILPHLHNTIEQIKQENTLIEEKLNAFSIESLSENDFQYYRYRLQSLIDSNNQYLDYLVNFCHTYAAFQNSVD
jgi:hypothetical protein